MKPAMIADRNPRSTTTASPKTASPKTLPHIALQSVKDAYARYDADPRVNGIDDFEAFRDAVLPLLTSHTNLT